MTIIHLEINCGVDTCASAPGEFCKYVGYRRFGTHPVCTLFPDADGNPSTDLYDKDGWMQRCDACKQCES